MLKDNALLILKAAIEAGKEILEVYNSDNFEIEFKDDNSPLTVADKRANDVIERYLEETKIPVLSEEGREVAYEERKNWDRLWIVDPLDGTKEFIKRNGEFTVNIAYIEHSKPKMGVVYVPVKDAMYLGVSGEGSFLFENASKCLSFLNFEEDIAKGIRLPHQKEREKYTIVASRSHLSQETQDFIDEMKLKHGEVDIESIGSSLKICLVAEGKADVYPRFAPTMEWDTAAGHAVVGACGKELIDYETGKEMLYNREELLNNWFIVR